MKFTVAASVSALAATAIAAPYNPFPLSDGFPTPSDSQLKAIEVAAGGALPGGSLPSQLTDMATVTLQLIALNEIFETAYFNDLLSNITNSVPGYELGANSGYNRTYAIEAISAIVNQEKLHYLGANAILKTAGKPTIEPCSYKFPVSDYLSAITFAQTFTDVVIGVLPVAQTVFAMDGGDEIPLVKLLGSIIAQESEQDGWYRFVQKKQPSAAPFLSTNGPSFALSVLLTGIVDGSCPNSYLVTDHVPHYPLLTVTGTFEPKTTTLTYSIPTGANGFTVEQGNASIVYLTGQNLPRTVGITNVVNSNGMTTFFAELPWEKNTFAKGLTFAALVKTTNKMYNSASEVAEDTAYVGIVEIA